MSVQSVVLEYHCYVSVLCGHLRYVLAVNDERARRNILKACNHTERGGFTTSRRTDENYQFTVLNVKIEVKDSLNVIVVYFV